EGLEILLRRLRPGDDPGDVRVLALGARGPLGPLPRPLLLLFRLLALLVLARQLLLPLLKRGVGSTCHRPCYSSSGVGGPVAMRNPSAPASARSAGGPREKPPDSEAL